ncbi:UNVERIFIED_ORG: amino acid transporter [Rahnella aquatilis]
MTINNHAQRVGLNKTLSYTDLVIYGMVFMIPIAPFAIYGYVSDISNGMVPLAYLIGLIGMFFTAYSYKLMSGYFPGAGSVYTYAKNSIGNFAGFISGWMLLLDYLLVPALVYIVAAAALSQIFQDVPRFLWVIFFLTTGTIANYFGIHITAKINKIFLLIQIILIITFVCFGLYALYHGVGAGQLTLKPFYQPENFHIGMVFASIAVCALSFLGFDGIATMSEEVKSDKKSAIGNAIILSLLIMGAVFVLQTWIAADLANGMHFKSLDTAFYEIINATESKSLSNIAALITAIMFGISCSLAAQAAIARLMYAMSRDGIIPSFLSKLHPKYKSPTQSLIFVAVISVVLSVIFLNQIDLLSTFVNFGALSGFILLHISLLSYYFSSGLKANKVTHLIFPILGIAIIGYVLYSMGNATWELGIIWLVVGTVYYLVSTKILNKKLTLDL